MKKKTVFRLQLVAVLWAVYLLVTGILGAFIETPRLDWLLFNSALFHISANACLWVLAVLLTWNKHFDDEED